MSAERENTGFACAEVESSLLLHAGGDLDPAAGREIEAHLARCGPCRARAAEARAAREQIAAGLASSAGRGPDLWPGVRAALVAEGRLAEAVPGARQQPRAAVARAARPRWGALAAAAAAALLLGFWLGRSGPETEAPGLVDAPRPVPRVEAQPVADVPAARPGGLRRVAPGEAALGDSAEIWVPDLPWGNGFGTRDVNAGVPASLERARPIH